MNSFFRQKILPRLVWWLYKFWSKTWRVIYVHQSADPTETSLKTSPDARLKEVNPNPVVFAHWHRDELSILPQVKVMNLATMTSTSKDGQLIDFVIQKFGGATSKGSSTRGGVGALKGLVRLTRSGHNASMAVDGPKGPIFEVKPGVFELSKICKLPIVPVGVASSRAIVFERSWNKARLPWPFSRICIVFGPSISFDTNDTKNVENRRVLGNAIANACETASKILRH